jgi:hypothetical protein
LLAPERQVVRDAEVWGEGELLVHHRDPEPLRMSRIAKPHRLPLDVDRAVARTLELREQLHQRRLSGAVLSGHRVDFAGANVEAHGLERLHTRKPFADVADLDQRLVRLRTQRDLSSLAS